MWSRLERMLGFSTPGNEYMVSVILLYAELFFIFILILILLVDIILTILYRFSNYRVVYHTPAVVGVPNSRLQVIDNAVIISMCIAEFLHDAELHFLVVEQFFLLFIFNMFHFIKCKYTNSTRPVYELNNIHTITFSRKTELSLELGFLFFPTLLVVYILTVSLSFLYNSDFNFDMQPFFSIFITGHQWYWTYEYHFFTLNFMDTTSYNTNDWASTIISFNSTIDISATENRLLSVDRHLVLPVNTPIMIYVTSTDVIHSWALPQFGIKVDAVPGKLLSVPLTSFSIGTFYGQCSELCGVNHGFMPIVVEFVQFDTFLRYIYLQVLLNK